ncbi:MAG: pyrroline-5-carboxylate reductase [Planctomycetota bacterium]|nr:MAG: pyrroline-5-carboxylate reductase [Planctomycetota bacterium]
MRPKTPRKCGRRPTRTAPCFVASRRSAGGRSAPTASRSRECLAFRAWVSGRPPKKSRTPSTTACRSNTWSSAPRSMPPFRGSTVTKPQRRQDAAGAEPEATSSTMHTQYEIGVIGAGNAAEGIIHGVLRNSVLLDDRVIASSPSEARRKLFAERFGIAVTADNRHVVRESYILLLAVKPQIYRDVVAEFADLVRDDHLIVSIMAGVSTAALESCFPGVKARVVRVMPNLASHVGAGMAGVHPGRHASEADLLRAQRIFDAGGKSVYIDDEALMDAVTAVSGTGPAYYYFFTEALIAAAQRVGLSPQYAELLAKQTALGAARMMLESGEPPDALREKVTSPGGTTAAAIESMRNSRVFEHIVDAVAAAFERSRELGR